MEIFKSTFTYIVDCFKHFFTSGYGEALLYLFLCCSVIVLLVKVFKR